MTPLVEKIFYVLTFVSQGSSFLHPGAYAVMHRRHHVYADTEKDPHSPKFVNNIFDFNKKTFVEYRKLVNQFINNDIFINDVPRWPKIEKLAESNFVRAGFVFLYIIFYTMFAPSVWFLILIPIHIFMGPIHGFIVNWFGHLLGYKNFNNLKDNSKNTLPIDILMMGELYQNNHHKAPQKENFAHCWFELDLGYVFAFILQKLKIIKLNRINYA